jgi:hypothetical protein
MNFENILINSRVVDPDPHGSTLIWLSSGSVLGVRIRIQAQGDRPKLTKKPEFRPFEKTFVPI